MNLILLQKRSHGIKSFSVKTLLRENITKAGLFVHHNETKGVLGSIFLSVVGALTGPQTGFGMTMIATACISIWTVVIVSAFYNES